jgi:ADP-ribose pyrophosphatase YjhB (NUDIX family)
VAAKLHKVWVACHSFSRQTTAMTQSTAAGPSVKKIPEGDDRVRLVCPDCGYIEYSNPKVVVGAVCTWDDKILLCRRAIEPRKGHWTLPAGFMELDESMADGAAREVWEEARAKIEIERLLGIYEIPHVSHVYVFYNAQMTGPEFAAGPESLDVGLFDWSDIPWDDLAFASVTWALKQYREDHPGIVHATHEAPKE